MKTEKNNQTEVIPQQRNLETNVEFLNLKKASTFLQVSESYLYKKIRSKEIPYYKTSKLIYFKRSDLQSWITKHLVIAGGSK